MVVPSGAKQSSKKYSPPVPFAKALIRPLAMDAAEKMAQQAQNQGGVH
jgi:hypothetical protein